jgi:hypothetical protein
MYFVRTKLSRKEKNTSYKGQSTAEINIFYVSKTIDNIDLLSQLMFFTPAQKLESKFCSII